MPGIEDYDLVVLGSGVAGKLLSWTLAAEGKRAAVVERKYVGGSCPNIACLPSKNVIHSAKVTSYFRRAAEFGVAVGDWSVDMAADRRPPRAPGRRAVDPRRSPRTGPGARAPPRPRGRLRRVGTGPGVPPV